MSRPLSHLLLLVLIVTAVFFAETGACRRGAGSRRTGCGRYDARFYTCCSGQLHHFGGQSCCGASVYDKNFDTCCNGRLSHFGRQSCCGTQAYNKLLFRCCSGQVVFRSSC